MLYFCCVDAVLVQFWYIWETFIDFSCLDNLSLCKLPNILELFLGFFGIGICEKLEAKILKGHDPWATDLGEVGIETCK